MSKYGMKLEDTINEIAHQYPLAMMDAEPQELERFNEIYLNPAQRLMYNFMPRTLFCRGSRGLGKTTYISFRLGGSCQSIPKGTGAFLGCSIKQLYCRTMPNTIKSMEQSMSWKEGVQFFRGRAPKSAQVGDMFPNPLTTPRIWENVIHFYNGSVCYLASTAVTGSVNSLNLCWVIGDECKYFPWQRVREEVKPALRGDSYNHPGWSRARNPYYIGEAYFSDGGLTLKQKEWEEEEKDQTDEVNDQICDMIAVMNRAQEVDAKHHTNYTQRLLQSKEYMDQLNYLRCKSRVFMNFSSLENLSLLTKSYIEEQKRSLPPLIYNLQILGHRKMVDKSGLFYTNFDIDTHGYFPNPDDETNAIYGKHVSKYKSVIDIGGCTKKIDYEAPDLDELQRLDSNSELDVDVMPTLPLYVAVDTNKLVNTMVISQRRKMEGVESIVVVRCLYVVSPKHFEDLCELFCATFAPHRLHCKDVTLIYDATAKQGAAYASAQGEDFRFYNIFQRIVSKRGWRVTLNYIGSPMKHYIKYEFINNVLRGGQSLFVRINRINCDYLIASLENSKAVEKYGEIHKDKSTEKKPNRTEEEQATDTDMSDAFDTLLIGLIKHPSARAWGGGRITTKSSGPIIL